eukprot:COSAG02_NODE_55140_length_292_cov_0.797927_1_plen_67_part_10
MRVGQDSKKSPRIAKQHLQQTEAAACWFSSERSKNAEHRRFRSATCRQEPRMPLPRADSKLAEVRKR